MKRSIANGVLRVIWAWLFCAGCSHTEIVQNPTGAQLPVRPAKDESYRLQPGDEIDVQVYREAQLSGTFRMDTAGIVRYPLVGAIRMQGLTVDEAENRLTSLLSEKYLVNPKVTISIVSAQSLHVVILGEVEKPGVQPIPFGETMTLLQAIANAGGFTEMASADRVTIKRTIDGVEQSFKVKVSKVVAGQEADLELKPNDVIMVPQIIF